MLNNSGLPLVSSLAKKYNIAFSVTDKVIDISNKVHKDLLYAAQLEHDKRVFRYKLYQSEIMKASEKILVVYYPCIEGEFIGLAKTLETYDADSLILAFNNIGYLAYELPKFLQQVHAF